jgi:hypothetical protein
MYPVQDDVDMPACVDDGAFAAQLHHFSEDADDAVLEVGEVGGEDAGGLGVVHFAVKASIYMLEMCVLGVANEVGWKDASWRKFASRVHVMSVSNPTSQVISTTLRT